MSVLVLDFEAKLIMISTWSGGGVSMYRIKLPNQNLPETQPF